MVVTCAPSTSLSAQLSLVSKLVTESQVFTNSNIGTHIYIDIIYFWFVHCLFEFELSLNSLLPISELNLISFISYTRSYFFLTGWQWKWVCTVYMVNNNCSFMVMIWCVIIKPVMVLLDKSSLGLSPLQPFAISFHPHKKWHKSQSRAGLNLRLLGLCVLC